MDLKRLLNLPPPKILGSGVIAGVVIALILAGGYHASGSPKLCCSCHSMELVYQRWNQTNHKQFACTECHLPDTNIAG
ncbi:MAG TPA: NapC/NirT family cytochrome c, partial [Syntrophales bacterium]|nr:NapC/NirT family cytochrome c [Syntrophales bacterium]